MHLLTSKLTIEYMVQCIASYYVDQVLQLIQSQYQLLWTNGLHAFIMTYFGQIPTVYIK